MTSALTLTYRDVYIAHLPGKAAGDCRTKRVTTGTAEIETYKKPPFPNLHGSHSSLQRTSPTTSPSAVTQATANTVRMSFMLLSNMCALGAK